MFKPSAAARVFQVPLGVDFSNALYHGLLSRFEQMNPEDVAQVEVYVNTRRMQRKLEERFKGGGAMLLPQIKVLSDLADISTFEGIPPAVSTLRRKLEVSQLVKALIEADPSLAATDSAFDLSDSLVALMGEMQGEGVGPNAISELDVSDQSGHWQRALAFINLVQDFFTDAAVPDKDGRQRRIIEAQVSLWTEAPPQHPILIAGSTGSRGATALLMKSVAHLPQGAIILPGFDTDMPNHVWEALSTDAGGEDHPQFRFKALCDAFELRPDHLPEWYDVARNQSGRTALVSLSLRPAPVTDQWISEGIHLTDLEAATEGLTLIEASSPRVEAEAIAVRLRQAVEDNQTAALISPDRNLTRQVTAAIDRWGIIPDDSAGRPLQLTAPGRFLRHMADLFVKPVQAKDLLVLLKHPLSNSGIADRGQHLLWTNALELELRRNGPPYPTRASLLAWAAKHPKTDDALMAWANWVSDCLLDHITGPHMSLPEHVSRHITLAEKLSQGPEGSGSGALWQEAAGREAKRVILELREHSDAGGDMSAQDYRQLIGMLLAEGEVRDRDTGHRQVLIWGTLEARVQAADLVILGGMNEGTWPEAPSPDPWLNRKLRKDAGLLLPDRKIGLSAHDYQQAVCAENVVISRSIRSDEAETVPSRWVNRLSNLLGGLTAQGGPACLEDMRKRGAYWLAMAQDLATPAETTEPAKRPSPRPPVAARPNQLSVTRIQTLIRDPYAIYAEKILKLKKLDPLHHSADAPLRGIIVHDVLERYVLEGIDPADPRAKSDLLKHADDVLAEACPWPAMRVLWRAKIASMANHFLASEIDRHAMAEKIHTELWGALKLKLVNFTLTGKADRIDLTHTGGAIIYDYKTGAPPTKKEQLAFNKQLLLEAAMVDQGAFDAIKGRVTEDAFFLGLGNEPKTSQAPLEEAPPAETLKRFEALIMKWMTPSTGYTSRRSNQTTRFEGAYDHLARYGEWDETHAPKPEDLS